ncbi:MAG: hypothetical protein QXS08_05640, partial [Nitrososphaerota archaeon]
MKTSSKTAISLGILMLYLSLLAPLGEGQGEIMWLSVSGTISPATAEYIVTSLEGAQGYNAVLIT